MVRVFLLLAAVEVVLVALALISCLSAEKRAVRGMPRALWVVVILLLPLLGPVLWFVAGRPRPQEPGGVRRKPPRPASPDDDPDFLRNLDAGSSNRDRELFERWEQDLHRREDEQRREKERQEKERREKEDDADEARHREE